MACLPRGPHVRAQGAPALQKGRRGPGRGVLTQDRCASREDYSPPEVFKASVSGKHTHRRENALPAQVPAWCAWRMLIFTPMEAVSQPSVAFGS